jgi:A/G-specific adenine glycosylase
LLVVHHLSNISTQSKGKLLRWFDRNARPLPWRRDRDAYRIWVSEVILQQTTVATVIPRFERFLAAFPNIRSLAAADEQSVLKEWEGLGYYSRARNLHRAARMLVADHDAQLPDDPDILKSLPGVGRYILGAVLSQAFNRRLPIVEANSKRVLCRLFAQTGDPKSSDVQSWLWETALSILPRKRIGDFNQAMMELGALICTQNEPDCPNCPLKNECLARREGLQNAIPLRSAKPNFVRVREVCIVLRHAGKVLLVRRPPGGRWGNMWEFPRVALEESDTHDAAARRLIGSLGMKAQPRRELTTIRYTVTHFRMTMICLDAIARTKAFRTGYYEEGRWLRPAELTEYPVSSPQRKLAAVL